MKYIFMVNPLAGEGKAEKCVEALKISESDEIIYEDFTKIENFASYTEKLDPLDRLVICGGDGTLNGFVNALGDTKIFNEIIYIPAGSGNDFMHDVDRMEKDGPFIINEYIENLPSVTVKDKKYRFVNGVGFGVDGYVCADGNLRRAKGKKVNYILSALKGLAYAFKPVNATVTVDGETRNYKQVWMTTTMKGRFFGGGMKITPHQNRKDKDGKISVLIAHDLSSLKILTLFPLIFAGKHITHTDVVDIFRCHSVCVKYDSPCFLQMDGETIDNVTEYKAESNAKEILTV